MTLLRFLLVTCLKEWRARALLFLGYNVTMANTRLLLAQGDNPDLLYEVYATDVSRGAEDARRLVLTGETGEIDESFLPQSLLKISNIGGLQARSNGTLWTKTKITQLVNWSGYASLLGNPAIDGIGNLTLPPNFFVPGRGIRIKLGGIYSVRSTGYYYLALYLNSLRVHLSRATYPTNSLIAIPTTSPKQWTAEVTMFCTAENNIVTSSDIFYDVGSSQLQSMRYITNKGEVFTIDSSVAQMLDLKCWSPAAYASDSVTVYPPAIVEVFG